METVIINTYKFDELDSDSKERAIADYRESLDDDTPWAHEIVQSLKAIFKASGITLRDYSLGIDRCYLKFDLGDTGKLTGKRALAWLENNLFSGLRIKNTLENRKNARKYGKRSSIGSIKLCPFTGICFDENYIEALVKEVKDGASLEDAYHWLANICQELLYSEFEAARSKESISEILSFGEYSFLNNGELYA